MKSSLRTAVIAFREAAHAGDRARPRNCWRRPAAAGQELTSKGVSTKTRPPSRVGTGPGAQQALTSHLPTHRPRSTTNSAACRTADSSARSPHPATAPLTLALSSYQPHRGRHRVTRPPPSLLQAFWNWHPSCAARRVAGLRPDPADNCTRPRRASANTTSGSPRIIAATLRQLRHVAGYRGRRVKPSPRLCRCDGMTQRRRRRLLGIGDQREIRPRRFLRRSRRRQQGGLVSSSTLTHPTRTRYGWRIGALTDLDPRARMNLHHRRSWLASDLAPATPVDHYQHGAGRKIGGGRLDATAASRASAAALAQRSAPSAGSDGLSSSAHKQRHPRAFGSPGRRLYAAGPGTVPATALSTSSSSSPRTGYAKAASLTPDGVTKGRPARTATGKADI